MDTLLLIDAQAGFAEPGWGPRNNPRAEDRMRALLAAWREAGGPIVHVRHDSLEPGSPLRAGSRGNAAIAGLEEQAGEAVLRKTVNAGFIGTSLEADLRSAGADALVIAGITTDHCVSTTVRMAANLGFRVTLAGDACFTFARRGTGGETIPADTVHAVQLASLDGEFARVETTEAILATRDVQADQAACP